MEATRPLRARLAVPAAVAAGLVAFGVGIVITARGLSDPSAQGGPAAGSSAVFDSAVLVFREGLEAILVLAAIAASLKGANSSFRGPVARGAGAALAATVVTWFAAIWVIGALGGPGLDTQAVTGLIAVGVLLVVMNWFFHRVYWTGWITHHTGRRKRLLERVGRGQRVMLGFALLGFTAVYREGFEIVLFLQSLRLRDGTGVVLEGAGLGLVLTLAVGVATFALNARLPYKRMLVWTGVLLGLVLVVMVGESAQELQLAGWLPTHTLPFTSPGWAGTWFAFFPTVETIAAQVLAAVAVLGSYLLSEYLRVKRPRKRGVAQAVRASMPPAPALALRSTSSR